MNVVNVPRIGLSHVQSILVGDVPSTGMGKKAGEETVV